MNIVKKHLKEIKANNRIWYKNFMKVSKYIEEGIEFDNNINSWLKKQRLLYKNGMLDNIKIELLEGINIDWYPEIKEYLNIIENLKSKPVDELADDIQYQQIKSVIKNDNKGIYKEVEEAFLMLGGN